MGLDFNRLLSRMCGVVDPADFMPIEPAPTVPPWILAAQNSTDRPAGPAAIPSSPPKAFPMLNTASTPTPINPLSFLTSLLSVLENPEDALLIEAAGHFINTVAAHNQKHLGAAAASTLETIGSTIQAGPIFATELSGVGSSTAPAPLQPVS